jgi:chromosome segregation ATPase
MADWNAGPGPSTQVLDWLFSRLAGGGPTVAPVVRAKVDDPGTSAPPPAIRDAADLQAAADWLQRERKRLEGYTQVQLARLQSEHEELVRQNYLNEEALILRSQELSRTEEMLATQSRALQQQAEELSRREQALAARHDLGAEAEALQQARAAAQADLEALAVTLTEQQASREKEQARLAARKAQLEARLQAAERAEAGAQRREAELDELEARLLREIEGERQQLAATRRELDEWQRVLEAVQAELFRSYDELESSTPIPRSARSGAILGGRGNQREPRRD